jgi:hypothetical protein
MQQQKLQYHEQQQQQGHLEATPRQSATRFKTEFFFHKLLGFYLTEIEAALRARARSAGQAQNRTADWPPFLFPAAQRQRSQNRKI